MTENKKNQSGQENQNDQQRQNRRGAQENSKRNDSGRTSTMLDEEDRDSKLGEDKEHDDREHQHDYKTPVGSTQERQGSTQNKNQGGANQNTRDTQKQDIQGNTSQNKNQGAGQNKTGKENNGRGL